MVVLLILLFMFSGGRGVPTYVTSDVVRGPLTVTVSATGTLQPVDEVDVGAEISGRLAEVLVDYNDHVTKGQVLARIDTEQLTAKLAQSRASLAAAQATVRQNDATLAEARTRAARTQALFQHSIASKQDAEAAQAELHRGVANLDKARADAALAAALVSQDQTALAKAEIRAPIDGIVLTRNVEPGQTIAVTFQTPILFTLASDLSQMELKIDVDEADIGSVREGQAATFTVDAFPQHRFKRAADIAAQRAQDRERRRHLSGCADRRQQRAFAAPRADGQRRYHGRVHRQPRFWFPMAHCGSPRPTMSSKARPRRRPSATAK